MNSDNNPVALITGASRGIGKAIALGLAKDGYRLGLIARSREDLDLCAKHCAEALGSDQAVVPFCGDVTDFEFVKQVVGDTCTRWGRIDLLVNNAGVFLQGSSEINSEDFNLMLDVNLKSPYYLLNQVVPQMKTQGSGYIFNVSSYVGVEAFPQTGAYSATKFGLMGLNQSLHKELAPLGIKVTAICPSWVNTDMAQNAGIADQDKIAPQDIYETIRYLLTLSPAVSVEKLVLGCGKLL